ncbi:D-alanine--D-alanine ligase [Candidatus Parcubacteria bacterium]|nr:D-alanine--D-alanine ligase [Candidatus Parcubacteria bacterium]
MPKLKIALLSGGILGEREVSLKTGEQIYNALDKQKYEIFKYDPKTDLKQFFLDAIDKKFDLVFPALHGPFGEDGKLQGMLDMIGMPYVFSNCLASALSMDKYKTKIIARDVGLNLVPDIALQKDEKYNIQKIINKLLLPIVIKPMELGSSVGMSIAKNEQELEQGIEDAFKHGDKVMLEKFIKGRELTVAVMDNEQNMEALPVIEIIPKISDWFDYKAKYEVGGSEEICPADIPDAIKDEIQNLAIKAFKAIGCKNLARADFIWDTEHNKMYFLEINTIPGMTQTSLVPQAAKVAGMEFGEFLDRLIENTFKST